MADGIGWLLEPHLVDCVTFVRGVAPDDVAGRLGAPPGQTPRMSSPQDAEALLAGSPCVARVGQAAGWTFAVEYGDAVGPTARGLASVSRDGAAAVSFQLTPWHPPSRFAYYADGAHLCSFGIGEEHRRQGEQPDLLVPDLEKLGVLPDGPRLDPRGMRLTMLAIEDRFGLRLPRQQVLHDGLPLYRLRQRLPHPDNPSTRDACSAPSRPPPHSAVRRPVTRP